MSRPEGSRSRRRIGRVVVAAVAASGLASAGLLAAGGTVASATSKSKSAAKVTITFANWACDTAGVETGFKAVEKTYEVENPTVTIVNQCFSYSTQGSRVLLEVSSRDAPTIAETQGDYTGAFYATGDLVPLTKYVKKEKKRFEPEALKVATYTGKLVGEPWTIAPFGLWYNKKLMKEARISSPPSTITELKKDLAKVQKKFPSSTGVIPFGIDTSDRTYGVDEGWAFMKDFGATPLTSATSSTVHVTTKHFLEYLTFMRFLGSNKDTITGDKTGTFRSKDADTEVVFDIDGPYLETDIRAINNETASAFDANWGVTLIPSGKTGKHYTAPTDHGISMFKTAKNKKAVFKFMNWLTTSPTAIKAYTLTYEDSPAPLKKLTKTAQKLITDTPSLTTFDHTIEPTVVKPPWGTHYGDVYTAIMKGVEEAMTTSTPLKTIAATIKAKADTALSS